MLLALWMNFSAWFDVPEKMNYLSINPFSFHVPYPPELRDEGKRREKKETPWENSLCCLNHSRVVLFGFGIVLGGYCKQGKVPATVTVFCTERGNVAASRKDNSP